ncbi:MAG: hypothetical protein HUK03_05820 [Bacteroidaceae bacterium]|nr:hypothetical protein [Bacteroidaceae bacterium]
MKEIKCPKCGGVFTVDEADYASIVSQVKNQEFEAELANRVAELEREHKAVQSAKFDEAAASKQDRIKEDPLYEWGSHPETHIISRELGDEIRAESKRLS